MALAISAVEPFFDTYATRIRAVMPFLMDSVPGDIKDIPEKTPMQGNKREEGSNL
jgi:hypothetical protein